MSVLLNHKLNVLAKLVASLAYSPEQQQLSHNISHLQEQTKIIQTPPNKNHPFFKSEKDTELIKTLDNLIQETEERVTNILPTRDDAKQKKVQFVDALQNAYQAQSQQNDDAVDEFIQQICPSVSDMSNNVSSP